MTKISKKTIIIAFLAFFLTIPAAFLLSACGSSHHFSETWTCDQNEHWRVCTDEGCDEVTDNAAHVFVTKFGENNHWQACKDCGYRTTLVEHTYVPRNDDDYHWIGCRDCGYTNDVQPHCYDNICDDECNACRCRREAPHDFDFAWTFDNYTHYHACKVEGCDARQDANAHYVFCDHDETNHYLSCTVCEQKLFVMPHVFDSVCDDNCNEPSCSYTRVPPHNFDKSWTITGSHHWHDCLLCNVDDSYGPHTYVPHEMGQICTGCNIISRSITLNVPKTITHGGDISSFQNSWISNLTSGDISSLTFEYFKLDDDNVETLLTDSELNEHKFPKNIGKYRVKITYAGGIDPASNNRIMPCSVTTDFSIITSS